MASRLAFADTTVTRLRGRVLALVEENAALKASGVEAKPRPAAADGTASTTAALSLDAIELAAMVRDKERELAGLKAEALSWKATALRLQQQSLHEPLTASAAVVPRDETTEGLEEEVWHKRVQAAKQYFASLLSKLGMRALIGVSAQTASMLRAHHSVGKEDDEEETQEDRENRIDQLKALREEVPIPIAALIDRWLLTERCNIQLTKELRRAKAQVLPHMRRYGDSAVPNTEIGPTALEHHHGNALNERSTELRIELLEEQMAKQKLLENLTVVQKQLVALQEQVAARERKDEVSAVQQKFDKRTWEIRLKELADTAATARKEVSSRGYWGLGGNELILNFPLASCLAFCTSLVSIPPRTRHCPH